MPKKIKKSGSLRYFFASAFILVSLVILALVEINPAITPIQATGRRNTFLVQNAWNGYILCQEITMKKDYLNGFDIFFTTHGRLNTNENVIMLVDSTMKTLYSKVISSREISDNIFKEFHFPKSLYVGRGNKIYLMVYNENASDQDHVSVSCEAGANIGKLFVIPIGTGDLQKSTQEEAVSFNGSMTMQLYETAFNNELIVKLVLFILCTLVALLILFYRQVLRIITRITLKPSGIYLIMALLFGLPLVFLTPPMQVPDEQTHFLRAYQISVLNIFKTHQKVPESLIKFDSAFQHLKFYWNEKTTRKAINAWNNQELDPSKSVSCRTVDYFFPYIPQAAGMAIGRIFNSSPLGLLYAGRIGNLIIAVLLVFLAIRRIPYLKWVLFILGLMPMTLFLFASNSYYALRIGLSFYFIAEVLLLALSERQTLFLKNTVILILAGCGLVLCRTDYFPLLIMAFVIPRNRFRSFRIYGLFILLFVISAMFSSYVWTGLKTFFPDSDEVAIGTFYGMPSEIHTNNSTAQVEYISGNTSAFIKTVLNSLFVYQGEFYLRSFVGILGWLDTALPLLIVYGYLVLLLLASLGMSTQGHHAEPWQRFFFLLFFLALITIIFTGQYIYSTPVAAKTVEGIQGRYFIPYIPILLLVLANNYIPSKLNWVFSSLRKSYCESKKKEKQEILNKILNDERAFERILQMFICVFITGALIYSTIVLMGRYYQIQ